MSSTRSVSSGQESHLRSIQLAQPESGCCAYLQSLLERVAKVFTDAFQWVQSFFSNTTSTSGSRSGSQQASQPLAPARVVPVTQQSATELLLNFYRGTGNDAEGRSLSQIWAWNQNQLETVHNYIQWLFPTRQQSQFNSRAPVLNQAIIQAFRNEPVLKLNLLRSFNLMLRFYGLDLDPATLQITRAADVAQRQANWLTPGNHNHLRITRILSSLHTLGLPDHARAFFNILDDIAQHEGRHAIAPATLRYWRNAARAY